MEGKNSTFWIGLGIGSAIGALAYHFSRTQKAKEIRGNVSDGFCQISKKASELIDNAKMKAMEAGRKVTDVAAEEAHKIADKADAVKERVDSYNGIK